MIKLTSVYDTPNSYKILYELLAERTPEQSISHKELPSWAEHCQFINDEPYRYWWFIEHDENGIVGAMYLTYENEIGIFIFKEFQGNSYATQAIELLKENFRGPFLANVNPQNRASRDLFEKLGGRMIQVTYEVR